MDNQVRYWDEDNYPLHEEDILEYEEELENEDDEYLVGYDSIIGNWDLEEYQEQIGFQKNNRRVNSIKTYYNQKAREKKQRQQKIRAEAKAKEKQRQQYYHYGDRDRDNEE